MRPHRTARACSAWVAAAVMPSASAARSIRLVFSVIPASSLSSERAGAVSAPSSAGSRAGPERASSAAPRTRSSTRCGISTEASAPACTSPAYLWAALFLVRAGGSALIIGQASYATAYNYDQILPPAATGPGHRRFDRDRPPLREEGKGTRCC